jgi:hypothetical protein
MRTPGWIVIPLTNRGGKIPDDVLRLAEQPSSKEQRGRSLTSKDVTINKFGDRLKAVFEVVH